MKKLGFFGTLALCLIGMALGAAAQGGTLTLLTDQQPLKFDPHLMHYLSTYVISSQMYNGLVMQDAQTGAIQPDLAQSWEVSADGLHWTFHLHEGVKFHNGREMKAADVKYSYDRIRDPETESTWRSSHSAIESIDVLDDYTVQINLKFPFAPLLEVLTWRGGAVVPQEVVAQYGDLNSNPCGTGPFMFVEYIERQQVTLAKNPNYFKAGLPKVDAVVFKIISEPATRQVEMLSGNGQVMLNPSIDMFDPLRNGGMIVSIEPSARAQYLNLQMGLGGHPARPVNDLRVRKAIAMSIDKDEITDAATFGLGFAIDNIVPLSSPFNMHTPRYERDIAAAKALLAEAGYPNGVTIYGLYASAGTITDTDLGMEMLVEQLAEAGITLILDPNESGTYVQKRAVGDFDFYTTATVEGLDPYFRANIYFETEPGGSFNKDHYSNPEVDILLQKAMIETDFAIREALYAEAFYKIFYEDITWIPLWSRPRMVVTAPNLKDFYFTALEIPYLEKAYLE